MNKDCDFIGCTHVVLFLLCALFVLLWLIPTEIYRWNNQDTHDLSTWTLAYDGVATEWCPKCYYNDKGPHYIGDRRITEVWYDSINFNHQHVDIYSLFPGYHYKIYRKTFIWPGKDVLLVIGPWDIEPNK